MEALSLAMGSLHASLAAHAQHADSRFHAAAQMEQDSVAASSHHPASSHMGSTSTGHQLAASPGRPSV